MNNNKLDEAAILAGCKGVFSKTSYITHTGQEGKAEEYEKKGGHRSAFAGKQLATAPLKEGKTVDVYFTKKHDWISDKDPYVDRIRYKDSNQEKKKGFYTSDFSKRDEFTNTIRTEQWREQLKGENTHAKKALDMFAEATGLEASQLRTSRKMEPEVFMYDQVFEKEDPGFDGASRTHRDTKNKTMLSRDRANGEMMTTTALAFQAPDEHHKPEHARKPLVRETFFRKTNVFFPEGCAADPST
ncbi:hypothetical protein CHLRE_10g424250v5 [Chlamydomonas reinhardtii]|uniref:Uncharacterized protein n=1 Tax=Chlamydomonas reinhardtii TaxID=3055 RepID=A8ICC1_CHLRE|nr:uncharacterized protein CHLRE_10g424250v5 [Chlamydomonas reinhardtii]6U42_7Z Chain 7Z, FAP90 [Chlamydomonas reinhardtii]6U42_8A Chain 8A, FAP90 [Chlamydomonas reinhardtii]6U42_8B Chain 8B, FAP90 [Chlamydomonas reinhardtii]6U42_8C Chain 8C, FAP90 [Chlamydomonas reinhardtii]6U42_8D Chain 8D, FAP90 [Chlamydomonas reinhardtii]8GLV_8B Chain 8B, Flagellar associated protein [Chlamydomonas reinhardtii]8GLV_8C Chain 8C, Flagellar associated protein [Chlamydomonas reinhardtii]8GLV_IG Chain IG, Fl|eukprot:XP_001702576.1 flagellar associated protein [Chlamydomonas reinhardtii]